MPHRKTFNIPHHAHGLTFSTYHRHRFLLQDRVRNWLVEAIGHAKQKHNFRVWAYVIMPDHTHLVIMPDDDNYSISKIIQSIKQPVGRKAINYLRKYDPDWIARLTRQRGKRTERVFWQSGGGHDRNVIKPKTLLKVIRYIHENPLRANLVKRTVDWQWSSARAYEYQEESPIPIDPLDTWCF